MALALFCAVAIAACGSSSSGSPTTGASTTDGGTTTEGKILKQFPRVPEPSGQPPALSGPSVADQRTYLRTVFDDTQALWQREFAAASQPYRPAKLVLFSQAIHATGCGAQADVGPFYCPADHGIYLDLNFFQLLVQRFGIGGFAQAYIVGHEFGHHVQTLLGISNRVAAANQADPSGQRARSVRVELQADCLAGVWAHSVYTRGQLTDDDLNQALNTAAVIGDDFQQRMAGRRVDSTLWTHGSSAQRQHWLQVGFHSGQPGSCDTFSQTTP